MSVLDAPPSAKGLRAWRERRGWTQEYAALAAGVHPRTWRRWERGERTAPVMLGRWCRAVDMILAHGMRPGHVPLEVDE